MAQQIRVSPTTLGTSDWRVELADGRYICDIRLEISSMLNASRYYVLVDGKLGKEGTFNFGVWDEQAVRDILTAIVRSMYREAQVAVDMQPMWQRAVGT